MTIGMIKYHLLVLFREPMNLFFGLGLPFLNLFLVSGAFQEEENTASLIELGFPMFIVVAVMVLCFMDSALSHAYARQIKFLRRLRMTPVKPIKYILTGVISRISVLLLFVATLSVVAINLFDMNIANKNWMIFISTLFLVFAMFYLISMFFANALKNAKNSQSLLYIVFFGLLFLGNAFFPMEFMPSMVRTIAGNTPTVYAANILQAAWMNTDILYEHNLVAVVVITVIFGLLSIKFFKYE
jgi:ABC-2 type transport system permease protein